MRCLICEPNCCYFLSKHYHESFFKEWMSEIGTVDYWKCQWCGLVLSDTLRKLETCV